MAPARRDRTCAPHRMPGRRGCDSGGCPARWPPAAGRRGCGAASAGWPVCPGGAGAAGAPAEGAVRPARRTHGAARSLLPPQPPLGPPAGEGLPVSPAVASCFQHVLAASPPRRRSARGSPGQSRPPPPPPARPPPAPQPRPSASPARSRPHPQPAPPRCPPPAPGHAVLPVPRRVPRRDRREYPSPRPPRCRPRVPRLPPPAAPVPAAPRPLRPSPPPRPLFARNGPGAPGSSRAAGALVADFGRLLEAEPGVSHRLAAS